MKTKIHSLFIALALVALSALNSQLSTAFAQGTAFTYQGQLNSGGSPANGFYDFQFSLSNAPSGGSQVGGTVPALALGVTNGLFTTNLDFGAVFSGNRTWLAISVRSNGTGSYTALTPLQELTPTPYAVFANTASNLSGTLPAGQLSGPFPSQLTGTLPLAQLPAAVVTNNESGVTLDNLTLGGNLTLPATATIYAGGNPFLYSDPNYNFFAGQSAGGLASGVIANTAVGALALYYNVSGFFNTAVGAFALFNNTNGFGNTAEGEGALSGNTSGYNNTGAGFQALLNNTTGSNNAALGYQAGLNITGSSNIDIGNPGLSSDNMVIRIGNGQTATYIAGTIALEGSDTNNGLVYTPNSGLPGINSSQGPFLYGYIGGALGAVFPNTVCLSWDYSGDVWVNNNLSADSLTVRGNFAQITGANANNGAGPIDAYIGGNGSGSDVQIGSMNSSIANVAFYNWGNSTYMHVFCSSITIEGGADLAEPFEVSSPSGEIPQGSVVVIDEENPGRLKVSSQPYDTRVAGVLSGANGINPGIQLQQQGLLEGGKNVALTGRVYVQADASNGAIKPGDLLTTSSAPGRAMKVTDHARASGAILGKAMTALKEGQGMVLVLVTLQ
jgi:hypothetical protein